MKKKIRLISTVFCLCAVLCSCGISAADHPPDADTVEIVGITATPAPSGKQKEEPASGGDSSGEKTEEPQDAKDYPQYFEEQSSKYAFAALNETQKYWYVDILRTLEAMETEVELHESGNAVIGVEGIDRIFQCVLNDHPEIFYVTGYTYTQYTHGEETVRITFSGTYTMDREEARLRKEQIGLYTEECLSQVPMDSSEYEKVKYVYEYLISHTEYNLEAAENQNICSVFIGRQSVCQGYAKATQYLLEKLGVEVTLVIGRVNNGEGHAWNLVRIDGQYYYVDTTWGDASYQIQEEGEELSPESLPSINYDYLCVTTRQLCQTHTIDNVLPMPECVSMDANYYVMEGAYFTEYNEEQLTALFQKGYEMGHTDVTLKCADEATYRTIFEELITNQQIFRYLDMTDGVVAYVDNTAQLSMTFWLTTD